MKKLICLLFVFSMFLSVSAQYEDIIWSKQYGARSMDFSPDSELLAVYYPGRITFFDVLTGDISHTMSSALSPRFSPDGSIFYAYFDGKFQKIDTETWESVYSYELEHPEAEYDMTDDERYFARITIERDTVVLYDMDTWERVFEYTESETLNEYVDYWKFNNASLSRDGTKLSFGATYTEWLGPDKDRYNKVIIYDIVQDKITHVFKNEYSAIFSPTEDKMLMGGKLYNANDFSEEPVGVVGRGQFSHDGKYLFHEGYVHNVETNELKYQGILIMALSYDNKYGGGGGGGEIDLADLSIYLTGITNQTEETNLYPNPSNGNVTIEIFLSNPELLNLKVTNLQGQQVDFIDLGMTGSGQQFINYNASALPSGQYFIMIFGGNVNLAFSLIKE
jgi:type IX secretion system substrate protein